MDHQQQTLLQITDFHLFADIDKDLLGIVTYESFLSVLNSIQSLDKVNAAILSGDLAQDESIDTYKLMLEPLAKLAVPKYYIPGNHDDAHAMKSVFSKQPDYQDDKCFVLGEWLVICLNSQQKGKVPGYLSDSELDFLQNSLAKYTSKHVVIFLHHHVQPVQSKWLDQLNLKNSAEFINLLEKDQRCRGVFSGHVHQDTHCIINGIEYFTSPSTCFQFSLRSDDFGLDSLAPGYRLIALLEDGSIDTSVHRVQDYAQVPDASSGGY